MKQQFVALDQTLVDTLMSKLTTMKYNRVRHWQTH